MADHPDELRVKPDHKLSLEERDPSSTPGADPSKRAEVEAASIELNLRLEELQERLWAQGKHRILVVLQAMDAGGKDATISKVFEHLNPSGVQVASFKAPSDAELAHDYLWRIHQQVPADGELVIFNRSHYEDILVVRVMDLVPEDRWRKRYRHIREFEAMLADEGVTILKFFLHISKAEQKERLEARLADPTKQWKFAVGDLEHRARWDDYMAAFEDALSETSTVDAPWFVIPADRKWYRDWAILKILVERLEALDLEYPSGSAELATVTIPD
ncbi:MAG: polyphosphate kinase 2 family protein [Actinomycetota bacterium]|nr:polyphosphate kinase 2 family protein [Actinomycetota bacterium]